MKKHLLLPVVLFVATLVNAQTARQYTIKSTGCTVKMPCNPGEFKLISTGEDEGEPAKPDSIVELEAKCVAGGLTYGVIYYDHGRKEFSEDYSMENYLKEQLAGQRDIVFDCKPSILGVLPVQNSINMGSISVNDEWEGRDGNWYLVKGYTDGKILAMLYVKKKGKLAPSPAIKAFLDSFTFPASN